MSNTMRLIEKIDLPNSLAVELYDYSRPVAGDRWLVGLIVRMPIEVTIQAFAHLSDGDALFREFLETNGPIVYFETKMERNFIDQSEKDSMLMGFLESFKGHCLTYVGRQDFAEGFIKRQVKDFLERRTWWK